VDGKHVFRQKLAVDETFFLIDVLIDVAPMAAMPSTTT
jgi:hypothetical protein